MNRLLPHSRRRFVAHRPKRAQTQYDGTNNPRVTYTTSDKAYEHNSSGGATTEYGAADSNTQVVCMVGYLAKDAPLVSPALGIRVA